MKRQILTLGAICAAAFTFTNCSKEVAEPQAPATQGTPFEIIASTADTKTTNDGLNTVWAEDDALNVFHAEAGTTTYGTNDKFTFSGADNKFTGTLKTALESGKSYDWYALYPVNTNSNYAITTPAGAKDGDGWAYIGDSRGAKQNGYDNTAHLSETLCPLYGVAKSISADAAVKLDMKHIASVVKVVVTNANEEPLTVSSITFTAPEDIVGSYYIDFTGTEAICKATSESYTSKTATLNVTGGTVLAKGESAAFYIPIKPFKAAANKLAIAVNGYEKTPTSTAEVEFKAGKIEAVNFKYDKAISSSPYVTTYTSNVTMSTGSEKSYVAKVVISGTEYDAIKMGASGKKGEMTIKVPAGATKLHIHAVGWKGKTVSLSISGATVSKNEIKLSSDDGVANNSPFTLKGNPANYYYEIGLSGIEAETTITVETDKERGVVFGVNAE